MNLGKGIIEDATPFVDFIMAEEHDHRDWPEDRRYKITYTARGNGVGFSAPHSLYFDHITEVTAWERREAKRMRPADSQVEYTVYEWYLGPKVLKHNWY